MRIFTNASVFDDTLAVQDGLMEIRAKVLTATLHDSMEDRTKITCRRMYLWCSQRSCSTVLEETP